MLQTIFKSGLFYYALLAIAVIVAVAGVFRFEQRRLPRWAEHWPAAAVPLLCLTLALLAFAPLLLWTSRANRFEWDQTYPESNVALGVQRVLGGAALYRDFNRPPFVVMPYPPLYYCLAARTCPQNRVHVQPLHVRAWGRYLTLLFYLGLVLLVFIFCGTPALRRELRLDAASLRYPAGLLGALCGALLFAAQPVMLRWANTCRPDLMALFFSALGLLLLYRFERAGILPALACCWIALFTKHSFIAAPFAVTLWHLLQRRWLSAGSWLLSYLCGAVLLLWLGQRQSEGLMLRNLLAVIDVPLRLEAFLFVFPRFLRDYCFVLVAGGWALWQLRHVALTSLLGCYLGVSSVLALLAAFKLGSSVNYFLEPALALSICAGLLGMLWTSRRIAPRPASVFAVMLAVALIMSAGNCWRIARWRRVENQSVLRNNRLMLYVTRQLQLHSPGPLLTNYGHLAVQFPEQLLLLDPYLLNKAAAAGNWDERELLQMLTERRVGVLALDFEAGRDATPAFQGFSFWSERVVAAIAENYRPSWRRPGVVFYVKK